MVGRINRRVLRASLVLLAAVALVTAAASRLARAQEASAEHRRDARPPIVFVHGNGDAAAIWTTVLWRFESNGYPRDRLFAIDLRDPTARAVDSVPQPGRSSTGEVAGQLAAFVQDVLHKTGARKVDLVGNSRGANTIRNYVKNFGGARLVEKVVLGGGVDHGVIRSTTYLVGSEFNGLSPFMQELNAGPLETVRGVRFLTVRSDRFDKFAQPDGRFLGLPGVETGVSYDAPALKGALNIVLPGVDHRETSFSPQAFAVTYRFLAGRRPQRIAILPEAAPMLNGKITGVRAGSYTNVGVGGAGLDIFAVDGTTGLRHGPAAYHVTTATDGRWGPFKTDPRAYYEFVVTVPGLPVTHIYRSPFPRGSRVVDLRPSLPVADPQAGSVVTMIRPRGYFGVDDKVLLDGRRPADVNADPVPNVAEATIRVPFRPQRAVRAVFEDERITARTWPQGEVAVAEFHF